jgi:hypothetical protein
MIGCPEAMAVELPACSVGDVERLATGRFLAGELIDVADADGVCSNRLALISTSRIQLILEDHQ